MLEGTGAADTFIDPAKFTAEPGIVVRSVAMGAEGPIVQLAGKQELLSGIDAGGELRPSVTSFVEQGGDLLGGRLIEHAWSLSGNR